VPAMASNRDMSNLPVTSVPVREKAPWYKPWLAEAKVIAMTGATAALAAVALVLGGLPDNAELLGTVPPWLQGVVLVLAPSGVSYLTGWVTRHTHRPDA
jgi:hypothetical protein